MNYHESPKAWAGSVRPGGRTARTRTAVLAATRELLVCEGVAGMRMERIAALSGVHRSSIYRRWGTPAGIVADLAQEIGSSATPPDTGSLAGDLHELAERLAVHLAGDGPALVRALLAWNDAEVGAHLAAFWDARRGDVAAVLRRHEVDGDAALATRLLAGPLYYEALIEGKPIGLVTVESAVVGVLSALDCGDGGVPGARCRADSYPSTGP